MAKKKNTKKDNSQNIDDTLSQISDMIETMEEIHFKNMRWLKTYDKKLFRKLEKLCNKIIDDKEKELYSVELNTNGALDIINRKDKTFMYNCEPFLYGDSRVKDIKKSKKIAFDGIGLGTHITSIIKAFEPKKVLICEDDIQIFNCSLFVTDYESLNKISNIKFQMDTKFDKNKFDEVVRFEKK